MKNTLFAIIAVLATASFTQASELQPKAALQYTVTAERIDFMVQRLAAATKEEIAKSLAQPIPASAIADANARSKPGGQVAIAKDAKKAANLARNHS